MRLPLGRLRWLSAVPAQSPSTGSTAIASRVAEMLGVFGFEVETYDSATGFLQSIDRGRPGCVVADVRMPGMDGATLLTTARDVAPDAVRILLTGHADAPSAMAAVNQGEVYRFLAKPCPPTALAEAVRTAVEHHHHLLAERELLERTLNGSIQLVIQVLEMANPVLFGRASQIRRMSAGVAQVLGVRERWPIELAAMFSRLAWISLPPETAERLDRGLVNSDSEQEMIDRLPQVADQLLSHVPRLGVVREILRVCDRVVGEPKRQPGNSEAELVITGSRILRAVLDFDTLQPHGAFIGSAAIIVLSQHDSLPRVAQNLMRFFRLESCGQCTPCRAGTAKAVTLLEAPRWDVPLLNELSQTMMDASICGLGQAAPNPVLSVMKFFLKELE